MDFFFRGLTIGFAIAAPVGAIGLLVIRRTLADGRVAGLATGLGAATADAFYGAVAGFGLTGVSSFLARWQGAVQVLGGLFLLWLGWRTFVAVPPAADAPPPPVSLGRAWATTFALTLTNPATILSFAAVFAGLGLVGAGGDWPSALRLVIGVFLGSVLWWLALTGVVSLARGWFDRGRMVWVNRIGGLLIAGFGVLALGAALLR